MEGLLQKTAGWLSVGVGDGGGGRHEKQVGRGRWICGT